MSSETVKIILYILGACAVIFLLVRIAAKPKKCEICGSETKDLYRDENDKNIFLCRNHLIERWEVDMNNSTEDMVVIEPDFKKYPSTYLYGTLIDLKSWEYPPESVEKIRNILSNIHNQKCRDCSANASVAFLRKEDFEWPFFEKISAEPMYICKTCVVKKVKPLISSHDGKFVEGFYAPRKASGVYHIQEF